MCPKIKRKMQKTLKKFEENKTKLQELEKKRRKLLEIQKL